MVFSPTTQRVAYATEYNIQKEEKQYFPLKFSSLRKKC